MNTDLLTDLDRIAEHKDGWMPDYKAVDRDVLARARTLVQGTPSLPEQTEIQVFWETGEIRLIIEPTRIKPKIVAENGVARLQEGTASTRLEAVLVIGGETVLVRNGRAPGTLSAGVLSTAQDHFDDATVVRFLAQGLLPTEVDPS